jgi:hypothetical protein
MSNYIEIITQGIYYLEKNIVKEYYYDDTYVFIYRLQILNKSKFYEEAQDYIFLRKQFFTSKIYNKLKFYFHNKYDED